MSYRELNPKYGLLKGGQNGDEGQQVLQMPGAVPPLLDDTGDCTCILVFPRDQRAGGAIDHHQVVEDPYELACKIFVNGENPLSSDTLAKLEHVKDGEEMEMELYQADIRSRFLEILGHSGIIVNQFPSLDRDEDFVTLTIPLEGKTIEYMAQRLGYSMPLKRSAYAKVKENGPYPGSEPMKNNDGQEVLAYDRFTVEGKDNFQSFRKVDAIRLLEFWLDQWVSLDAMEDQGVITGYYPCPDPEELVEMHHTILSCSGFTPANTFKGILCIRSYFGDQIAFFFRFMVHLCNSLIFLAVVGAMFYLARVTVLQADQADILRTSVAAFVSLWAACMLQVFKRHTSRVRQIWGVTSDEEPIVQINPDWDYESKRNCGFFVNICTVLYIFLYVGAIFGVLAWQFQLDESDPLYSYSSLILVAVIKGGNLAWSKLAPCLVSLENLRTERAYEEKLSALLAGVKLFVANWPFFSHAFLTNYLQKQCSDTLEAAAAAAFDGLDVNLLSPESMKALQDLSFKKGDKICLPGCLPSDTHSMNTLLGTTCGDDLRSNLQTYFFILIAVELAFLVLPIVLSYVEILKEYRKVQSTDSEEGASSTYTFLQWEAKKFPYIFDSWGGDKINDYLEIAISYSVIVCWGSLAPVVAVFGCIQFFVSYRLRIYRMLYVTRRPQPRVAAGLGIWSSVFQAINVTGVATNVGLICFFYSPGISLELWQQIALFLLVEHVVLVLQSTVQFLIPETGTDVESIKFYNDHCTSLLRNSVGKSHHDQVEATGFSHINLATNPENLHSEDEDESSS